MNTQWRWVLDAATIIIFVYVLYSNGKRGLAKVLLPNIGYAIAAILTSLLAAGAAPALYETVARPSNITAIETANKKIDIAQLYTDAIMEADYGVNCTRDQISAQLRIDKNEEHSKPFDVRLYDYVNHLNGASIGIPQETFSNDMCRYFVAHYGAELAERLPRYVREEFKAMTANNLEEVRGVTDALARVGSAEAAAEYVEDRFGTRPTTEVLRIFVYLILFSILMVFVLILAAMLQNKVFINVTREQDHLMGAVLGILESCAMIILLTMAVRLLVQLGGGEFFCFNDEAIEKTMVFRTLYNSLGSVLL